MKSHASHPSYARIVALLVTLGLWSALFAGLYVFRDPLTKAFLDYTGQFFPCKRPILYSIGAFDARFGIKEADLLKAIGQAEQIWEGAIGRDLFAFADDGPLKISLIYDHRQAATDKLDRLGITIGKDEKGYEQLKVKYDALQASVRAQKSAFEKTLSLYEAKRRAYEEEVAAINRKGGAKPGQAAVFQQRRTEIDAETDRLKALQAALNDDIDTLNDMSTVLNRLASALNLKAVDFNKTNDSLGETFEEGRYVRDATSTRIDIYQFDTRAMLVRVLAHELGHAVGMGHVEDPVAIMYRLNRSTNEKVTAADMAALKGACGI